jgi:hypothetical protein
VQDAYEEAIDMAKYLKQTGHERRALIEYVGRLEGAAKSVLTGWNGGVAPIERSDTFAGGKVQTYLSPSAAMLDSDVVVELIATLATSPLSGQPQPAPAMSEREKRLEEALRQCIKEIPYCEHDYTTRLGAIWTFCEECGGRWADDEGGVPQPQMPKGMAAALALLEGTKPAPPQEGE